MFWVQGTLQIVVKVRSGVYPLSPIYIFFISGNLFAKYPAFVSWTADFCSEFSMFFCNQCCQTRLLEMKNHSSIIQVLYVFFSTHINERAPSCGNSKITSMLDAPQPQFVSFFLRDQAGKHCKVAII